MEQAIYLRVHGGAGVGADDRLIVYSATQKQ